MLIFEAFSFVIAKKKSKNNPLVTMSLCFLLVIIPILSRCTLCNDVAMLWVDYKREMDHF